VVHSPSSLAPRPISIAAGVAAVLVLALTLVLAAPAGAAMVTFGPNLSSITPTLDTANGASSETSDMPLSMWNTPGEGQGTGSPTADEAISTTFAAGCTDTYGGVGAFGCTPWNHDGADNTLWNTAVVGGPATTSQDGQVLEIDVKGCTVQDMASQNQSSSTGSGGSVPSNTMQFQTLAPQSGGGYKATATAGLYTLPWCSNSSDPTSGAVNTSTVTKYNPVHMCIKAGDTVGFYDLGGQIPSPSGPSFYPQGAPFMVIGSVSGGATDSFADADVAGGVYTPGAQPRGNNSGWGTETNQELTMSVVEGTVEDAYGLCPGGKANEPTDGDTVICVYENNPPAGYTPCPGYTGGTGGTGSTGSTGATGSGSGTKLIVGKLRLAKYAFKARKGTTITYQDNLAGTTTLTVTKMGRSKVLWQATHTDTPGLNTLKFLDRRLRKGFYTLTISTTYSGQPARVNTVGMRIVT
jgi:hypothetical protein